MRAETIKKWIKRILIAGVLCVFACGLGYAVRVHGRMFYPRELENCNVWVYNPA